MRGIAETLRLVRSGDAGPGTVLDDAAAALSASERGAAPVHAFLSADPARWQEAMEALRVRDGWRDLPLAGVPIAVKDNIATVEYPTTCGSRLLEGYRSPFDATVVRRLVAAGAVLVGKTNLDEFAMGSSTRESAFGITRNPLDRALVPGGSSGGSAAAVAAGIVPAALGSDTGGSVRQPAAFCGVVGLKPTYGRVSRYGLVAFASSLDHVGVLAATVRDAARVLEVIAGADPFDATCVDAEPAPVVPVSDGTLRGRVVGVPLEYFPPALAPEIGQACNRVLSAFEALGATVREISLPHTRHALAAYHAIAAAEASTNLARFDGIRFGPRRTGPITATRTEFGAEVKRRLLLGAHLLSSAAGFDQLARAQGARAAGAAEFAAAFRSGIDVILTPTTPTLAWPSADAARDADGAADAFTAAANLAGLPALSLPVRDRHALPVGVQLIGPAWSEPQLLAAAGALEDELARSASRG